ncbi:MAG: hypothetical protein RQ761_00720 [Bacteroidales bacterium]|nr:hypothetical protein [Bacteroidales bacterium]
MKTIAKTLIIAISVLMLYPLQMTAQDEDVKNDKEKLMAERYLKMQQLKIAYITGHLDLSIEEAEKFWPVYRKYEAERNEITSDLFKRFERPAVDTAELSDAEAKKLILQRLEEERALVELKYQSFNEYLEILPAAKIYKLFEVENRFRRHLMERLGNPHDKMKPEQGARGKPMQERAPRR